MSKDESVTEALLPCPFCGGDPWVNVLGIVRCSGKYEGHHPTIAMPREVWAMRNAAPVATEVDPITYVRIEQPDGSSLYSDHFTLETSKFGRGLVLHDAIDIATLSTGCAK